MQAHGDWGATMTTLEGDYHFLRPFDNLKIDYVVGRRLIADE
jgi:hypothetical protein